MFVLRRAVLVIKPKSTYLGCIWAANTVLALVRHMQLLHRVALGAFTAPVIASGGVCLSVPHQLLHGGEIRAGVKEVAGKGPA